RGLLPCFWNIYRNIFSSRGDSFPSANRVQPWQMQSTAKKPRRRYEESKEGRHTRYRRLVPPELRHLFDGKAQFIRSLKDVSYSQAHAEFERIASAHRAPVETPRGPYHETDLAM